MIAGRPEGSIAVPKVVNDLLGGSVPEPVWRNQLGGLTFEIPTRNGRRFLKWAPDTSGIDLTQEISRLRWASAFCVVPTVLDHGRSSDGTWMLTQGLPGDNAVSEQWVAHPGAAVAAIGAGLRVLHDSLPVEQCPFSWSATQRVTDAQRRAEAGQLDPGRWHDEHRALGVAGALHIAARQPAVDQLVVCHGDACAPNTIIGPTGHFTGHVDLGALGTADRWADLAVATWSTQWNYGPGWEATLLTAYGIQAQPERTAYYRLLWDLDP